MAAPPSEPLDRSTLTVVGEAGTLLPSVGAPAVRLPDGSALILAGGTGATAAQSFRPSPNQDPAVDDSYRGTLVPLSVSAERIGGDAFVLVLLSFALAAVELPEGVVVLGQVAEGYGVADLKVGAEAELVVETLYVDDEGERTIWRWKPTGSEEQS